MKAPDELPPTMTAALALFRADDQIDPKRRMSIIADVEQAFARSPDLPALPPVGSAIAHVLARYRHNKRQKNLRSSVRALVRWVHEGIPFSAGNAHTPAWDRLLRSSSVLESDRYNLYRLGAFCSGRGISPEAITDRVMENFGKWLRDAGAVKNAEAHIKKSIRCWNKCYAKIKSWPDIQLTPLAKRTLLSPKLENLGEHVAFQIGECLEFMGAVNPHEDNQPLAFEVPDEKTQMLPPPELEKSTLAVYERSLRRAVRIISQKYNRRYDDIDLQEICDVEVATMIMNTMAEELHSVGAGNKALLSMIGCIIGVAKHHFKVSDSHLNALRKLKKRIKKPKNTMTAKNVARLRKIVGEKRQDLFRLPATLINPALSKIAAGSYKRRDLVDAAIGVAIAIFLNLHLRIGSMCKLQIGKHLIISRSKFDKCWAHLTEDIMKNDVEIHRSLPDDLSAVIRAYITHVRPLLHPNTNSSFLFPGDGRSGYKTSGGFSMQISQRILKHLGIEINPHLFRHLGAIIHLEEHPGDYQVVTIMLGNSDSTLVKRVYSGLELQAVFDKTEESFARKKREAGLNPKNMLLVARQNRSSDAKQPRKKSGPSHKPRRSPPRLAVPPSAS